MADLEWVRTVAHELIRTNLDEGWSFAFDNAKKRAGLCNYTERRITVSRYLAQRHADEEVRQTLLHEVAHAIAGHAEGHGPAWRRVARELGYVGGTTHSGEVAAEFARWLGRCPNGHEFLRFRRPSNRAASCAKCSRTFDRAYLITWRERTDAERIAS